VRMSPKSLQHASTARGDGWQRQTAADRRHANAARREAHCRETTADAAGRGMPRISDERKVLAGLMLAAGGADNSYERIIEKTGPRGDFPFAEKDMSIGTIHNLKMRQDVHGSVTYRKKRVDLGTLTFAQQELIVEGFRGRAATSTAELRRLLEAAGCAYRGRSQHDEFPLEPRNHRSAPIEQSFNQDESFRTARGPSTDVQARSRVVLLARPRRHHATKRSELFHRGRLRYFNCSTE
jgi:hypothetical protein